MTCQPPSTRPTKLPWPAKGDLVLLEQALDAGQLLDDLDLRAIIFGTSMVGVPTEMPCSAKLWQPPEQVGGVQQRLRRDAADVQAGAAQARFALRIGVGVDSAQAVLKPSCAARIAAT